MSELLVVPAVGTSPALAISDEAIKVKTNLLIRAYATGPIPNESERDRAIQIAGSIQAHLKAVEKSRVEVKEPFLQMGREIDRVASEHVATLTGEKNRINRLVGTFESDRQETSRLAAVALADEQDKNRPVVEDAAQPLEARLEAEERIEAAGAKLEQAKAASEAAKPTGGALRRDWDIEVTDIKALYAAHPQCVELTARNMAIKDLLKAGIEPPGVRATPKVAYTARATTRRLK